MTIQTAVQAVSHHAGRINTQDIQNIQNIRSDFPILARKIHGKALVYLDSAATAQKPRQVIETEKEFYEQHNANIHRGVYKLSEEATIAYESAHDTVAEFINAAPQEIIFTRNTTESINLVSYAWGLENLRKGDEIVLTQLEHHSNIVPWQQIAKKTHAVVKFIPIQKNGTLDMDAAAKMISEKTRMVAAGHVSNALGTVNDIKALAKLAHAQGALFLSDAAQAVPHFPVDVKALDVDFMAFSGHKMLAPTGIGVLYGRKKILEMMQPFLSGGDMIREVAFEKTTFNDLPWKFEAGTSNIAGGIGLGAAVDYLNQVGMEKIHNHVMQLTAYAYSELQKDPDITLYGPELSKRSGIISFNLKGVHPHDLAQVLDHEGIAIRGGHHCAMPLMDLLGISSTSRASFYLYNTMQEVDAFITAVQKAKKVFSR